MCYLSILSLSLSLNLSATQQVPESVHILYLRLTNFSLMEVLSYNKKKLHDAHVLNLDPP